MKTKTLKLIDWIIFFALMVSAIYFFVHMEDAQAASTVITWDKYTDPNNGTYNASNYSLSIECKTGSGAYSVAGTVAVTPETFNYTSTNQPGDVLTCRARVLHKPSNQYSDYTGEGSKTFPFGKPGAATGLKLSQ